MAEDLSTLGIDVFIDFTQHMIPGEPSKDFYSADRGMAFGSAGRIYTHFGRMAKLIGKNNALKTYRPGGLSGVTNPGRAGDEGIYPKEASQRVYEKFHDHGGGRCDVCETLDESKGKT